MQRMNLCAPCATHEILALVIWLRITLTRICEAGGFFKTRLHLVRKLGNMLVYLLFSHFTRGETS